MKIKCLLVDDEPLALDVLESYIQRVEGLELVSRCENALQAFDLLLSQPIDLIFLDIQMPRLDGIEFLKTLHNPPKVIFTTAYRDYAIEAFELDVVDYLLKPIPFSRFLKAVNKAFGLFQQKAGPAGPTPAPIPMPDENLQLQSQENIIVRADKKMIKVPLEEIQYIESLKDYVIIYLPTRRIVTKQKISYLEQKLPEGEFLRIHRSFLIAIKKIRAFSPNHVEINNQELPIGRSYKSEVSKALGIV
jgi:DNA-binding LytR/AlgR family response regulator